MKPLTLETIDFTAYDDFAIFDIAQKISNICEFGYGFFYLKIQPNQASVVKEILDAAKDFFELPNQEKMRLVNDESCYYKIGGKSIAGTGIGIGGLKGTENIIVTTSLKKTWRYWCRYRRTKMY